MLFRPVQDRIVVKNESCEIVGFIFPGEKFHRPQHFGNWDISWRDMLEIALKQAEVDMFGLNIPVCPTCHGTPNFPNELINGDPCIEHMHSHTLLEEIDCYKHDFEKDERGGHGLESFESHESHEGGGERRG